MKKIISRIKENPLLVRGIVDTNYYLIAQVFSRAIAILVIPIVARILTVKEFATYDLFLLISSFISLLATLGIDSGMAIKIVESKDNKVEQASLLKTSLMMSTAVLLLLWTAAIITSRFEWFPITYSMLFINGLFVYTLFAQFNYTVFGFVRWVGKAKEAAWINFITYFLGITLGFLLLIQTKRLEFYVLGIVIGNFFGSLLSTWIVRDYLFKHKFIFQYFYFKDLMKLSLPYLPTYLSNFAMQFVDRLLITNAFGMEALGLYAIVNRIAQIPMFAINLVSYGFQPVIFNNYGNQNGKGLSQLIFNVFWISIVPLTAIIIVFGEPLLSLFGGEKYLAAIKILPFIIVSTLMLGSFYLFGFGYAIKRKTIYVTLITITVVGIIYFASLYLIPIRGISGVAEATFLATTIGAVVYIWLSERLYAFGYQLKWMFVSIAVTTGLLLFRYYM